MLPPSQALIRSVPATPAQSRCHGCFFEPRATTCLPGSTLRLGHHMAISRRALRHLEQTAGQQPPVMAPRAAARYSQQRAEPSLHSQRQIGTAARRRGAT